MPSSSLHRGSSTKATHDLMGDEKSSSLLNQSPPTKRATPHNPTDMAVGGEKTETETKLERDGNINALQRYRYLTWRNSVHPESSCELLDTEKNLREVVQEDISIKEGAATPGTNAEERLSILNKKYWLLSQRWWYCRSDLENFQSRGFILWRSHPQWYMHLMLVEECAGR